MKLGYLVLTKELMKLQNVKVTVVPIVIGAPETVPKSLEKERLVELIIIKSRVGRVNCSVE